jgi:hypothetical protein
MNFAWKSPWSLVAVCAAIGGALIIGLAYWFLGSSRDSTHSEHPREAMRASSETDRPEEIQFVKIVHPEPLKLTDEQRKASNEILSGLQEDLHAIELANAEVIYRTDNQFVQETFIQIFPPEPEQVVIAWENLMQRLGAKNLPNTVAQDVWSKAQEMEQDYVGRRDLPFRILHSFRAKLLKAPRGNFEIRSYEQKPDIRFTAHGSPFLSSESGGGMMQGPDLDKKENLERYKHLLPLMPELSPSKGSEAEQTKD